MTEAMNLQAIANDYHRDGYASGLRICSLDEANYHRGELERAEQYLGHSLHYKAKAHTVLRSPYQLATHPLVLDIVEALLGPDILLYDTEYIIKEPKTLSHVSWHQDLTFWGLSEDDQVSLWLALSPATETSGCMRMIPGSHSAGRLEHLTSDDETNVLLQSQTVSGVDETKAIHCPLQPGQASFHHGWTLHASMPNNSTDRRIGLNAQYITPRVRQTKHDRDSAMLVRGQDLYRNFSQDLPARYDFEPQAMKRWAELNQIHVETQGSS